MQNLTNIEKSAFRKGEYVGYGGGLVWHIRKSNSSFGNWIARPQAATTPNAQLIPDVYAMRLQEMSVKLESWKPRES